jgi:hypothetical protein
MWCLLKATKLTFNFLWNKSKFEGKVLIMTDQYNGQHLKLWTPAIYRIEVEGIIDIDWADSLAGMLISSRKRADQSTVTIMTGRLRDQAELTGVLNSLYELHLPILSVNVLTENGNPQDVDKSSQLQPKEEDAKE